MKIVVEYSKSQNAFHRSTEQERVKNERQHKSDYEVVADFGSYEDADKFIAENYDSIKQFGYFKNQKGELVLL